MTSVAKKSSVRTLIEQLVLTNSGPNSQPCSEVVPLSVSPTRRESLKSSKTERKGDGLKTNTSFLSNAFLNKAQIGREYRTF